MKTGVKISLILLVPAMLSLLAGCKTAPLSEPQSKPETAVKTEQSVIVPSPTSQTVESSEIYSDFTEERYQALVGKQPFALFFHASWCPTCWAVEADIKEHISEFPAGVVILKVDYDTATELKAKYKIVSQSVIVLVDSNGEAVKTLVAPSFSKLNNEFRNLLQ